MTDTEQPNTIVIKTFYKRLGETGKPKKVALTACIPKLLIMLSAMVKSATPSTQAH